MSYDDIIESYKNPTILRAIIMQESAFNAYAIRYEPAWNYLYIDIQDLIKSLRITLATEIQLQKMSWGLGQIMGSVARELGYDGILTKLIEPELNIQFLDKFVQKLELHTRTAEELFSCYNGGLGALSKVKDGKFPNQAYVDSAMKHYQSFGG